MNLLPFGKLPAYRPQTFVPPAIDLGDWPQIAPLFEQLEKRAPACQTAADLERWLLNWSELNAALDEESSRRYIAMTCHTDNPDAEKAYLHFVENVEPQLKPRQFALETIYVAHPLRGARGRTDHPSGDRCATGREHGSGHERVTLRGFMTDGS